MLNPNAKRYANSPSPRLMKLSKKRKRKHLANAFSGRAWKFHTSGNNGNRRNKPWMRYILLLRSINDLQVKKNRIQYNNHMDPKKSVFECVWPFCGVGTESVHNISWNTHMWKPRSNWVSIEHVDQQDNIWCATSIRK